MQKEVGGMWGQDESELCHFDYEAEGQTTIGTYQSLRHATQHRLYKLNVPLGAVLLVRWFGATP